MTKINKILMHGFKSFAKHTEIYFNSDFNCILGPNGAGKSNVLDAICFVLGKSSSKSLRAERASNLIYNGGKTKNPAKQGEVSIYFDNANKYFPLEAKEVKISRVVRQNGQSLYKINDKTMTREQILELLSASKINPDGYNIILQGDIIRFVEMHHVERRQLIEEISGISIYEEKKNKAVKELDNVDLKLKTAEIILTERAVHLKELKKDRDEALKFKEMNDKMKGNKASLIALQIERKTTDKGDVQKKIDECTKQLNQIKDKIGKLKQENTEK
ncbi:MAG: AAA family ATPase, partial [Nanoarchaeota archaeon]